MILGVGQHGVGEELVEHDGVVADAPVLRGLALQLGERALGGRPAHVAAHAFVGGDVVEEQREHRAGMQVAEMIELEEGVDHQLPVHARPDRLGRMQFPALHVPARQVGVERAEIGIDVEAGVLVVLQRRRHDPDQAVLLGHLEAAQAVLALVEVAERGTVGDADQPAGEVVAPAVIGADEGALVRAAGLLLDGGAAMATDVEEGAQHAVGATRHQDRLASVVMDDEVARLAQLAREGDDDGIAAEQEIDLALEAHRIVIPFDRGMADAGAVVPRVGTHHTQHTLEIRDLIGVLHCRLRP